MFKVHDAYFHPSDPIKKVLRLTNSDKVIYISRHPCDVLVSVAQYMKLSILEAFRLLSAQNATLSSSRISGLPQVRQYLGPWDFHVQSWCNNMPSGFLQTSYEALYNSRYHEFGRIFKYIYGVSDYNLVASALNLISFNQLESNEKSFNNSSSESVHFGRRMFWGGVPGSGAKLIDKEIYRRTVSIFKETLDTLGY